MATNDLAELIGLASRERRATVPGWTAYTERDGGDWYVIAGDQASWHGEQRLAEGFDDRDDARRVLLFLMGARPWPRSWRVVGWHDQFCTIAKATKWGDEHATIWTVDLERAGLSAAGDLLRALPVCGEASQ